jgi:hypothetical protein
MTVMSAMAPAARRNDDRWKGRIRRKRWIGREGGIGRHGRVIVIPVFARLPAACFTLMFVAAVTMAMAVVAAAFITFVLVAVGLMATMFVPIVVATVIVAMIVMTIVSAAVVFDESFGYRAESMGGRAHCSAQATHIAHDFTPFGSRGTSFFLRASRAVATTGLMNCRKVLSPSRDFQSCRWRDTKRSQTRRRFTCGSECEDIAVSRTATIA